MMLDKLFNWQPGATAPRDRPIMCDAEGRVFLSQWEDTGDGPDVLDRWCEIKIDVVVRTA